jgi:hypothetical protein
MTTLKQPAEQNQKLATEWTRQYASGEIDAGYWTWYASADGLNRRLVLPLWYTGSIYSYEPAPAHPHYAIYKEWEAHKESEAVKRGEYELEVSSFNNVWWYLGNEDFRTAPTWDINYGHKIKKTSKHPDNCKPKLKLIDWKQVPAGAMTNCGVLLGLKPKHRFGEFVASVLVGWLTRTEECDSLRIISTTKWTAIQDGEQPPVCDGLVIEYQFISLGGLPSRTKMLPDDAISIAYRVIGLAKGYTDNPELGD